MKRIALALALTAACDPDNTAPREGLLEEGFGGELESMEYARKVIASCVTIEMPVTITLRKDPERFGLVSFSLLLESNATKPEVSCLLGIIEAAQP